MHETGWCAVQITDICKHLAFRVEQPSRAGDDLIERAREWVKNSRQFDLHYPLSDEQWIEQTICSDLIKAVVWNRGDLLPDLGRALITTTGFVVVLVRGTSDGLPSSLTELLIPGEALSRDFAASESFPDDMSYQPPCSAEGVRSSNGQQLVMRKQAKARPTGGTGRTGLKGFSLKTGQS